MPPLSGACRAARRRDRRQYRAQRRNRKKMAVVGEGRGRPALTRYRVERAFKTAAALVECRLATGRTHQIRVHLAASRPPADRRSGLWHARRPRRRPVGRESARASPRFRAAGLARPAARLHPSRRAAALMVFDSALPADLHALFTDLERL